MFCPIMMPAYGYTSCEPTYGCTYRAPAHRCSPNPMALFGRFMMLMILVTFGPVIFVPLLLLIGAFFGFVIKVALFGLLVAGIASLLDSAFSTGRCHFSPCRAKKRSSESCPLRAFMKTLCPCNKSKQAANTSARDAKPASCGQPKNDEPPPQTHHRIELCGSADAYHLTVDVPGIRRTDLSVTAQPWSARTGTVPTITIAGTTNNAKVHRVVRLPRDAEADQARVSYADGQLALVVPRATSTAQTIAVHAASTAPSAATAPSPSTPPPMPPVVREVMPDASNVQLPEEAFDSDEATDAKDDWEPVGVEK